MYTNIRRKFFDMLVTSKLFVYVCIHVIENHSTKARFELSTCESFNPKYVQCIYSIQLSM